MADPDVPGAAQDDEDSEMDEAADLEMLDRLNEEGAFDTDDDDEAEEDGLEDDEELDEIDVDEDDEDEEQGGAPLSPSAIPLIGPASTTTETTSSDPSTAALLHPHRPTPYTHDAGHLLVIDPNPLPPDSAHTEAALAATTRDAAQSLLNHLLTTCPVRNTAAGVTMALPKPTTALPREKRVPTPKAPTKWEAFAAKKGIGKFARGSMAQQDREGRAGKMVFDKESGEWVPKYGYKGRSRAGEDDWLVEIDDKKARPDGQDVDPRAQKRAERKDRVKRNERAQRANERRARQTV